MSTDNKYNGWTNYETWRVNLEILSDLQLVEYFPTKPDTYELAEWLKDYVDDVLTSIDCAGITLDFARAFVSEVNWREIAENGIDAYYSDDDETDNNQG
jgi:predicted RNA-binding protein with EMAP domain